MKFHWGRLAAWLVIVCLGFTAEAAGKPPANPASSLSKRYGGALVSVSLVVTLKMTVAGKALPPRELKRTVVGTVISPTGLVVLSLAALDPAEMMDGSRISGPAGSAKVEVTDSQYSEVKIRRADGEELEARVVLKDNDLDLVFVAPLAANPTKPFGFVDLGKVAVPELLDTAYLLSRASTALSGSLVIQRSDIISIINKPQRRLMVQFAVASCPLFDAEGRVYGICVRQIANGRPAGNIVLPAIDVAEIAKQAAAIKPDAIVEPPVFSEQPAVSLEPPVDGG